MVSCDGLFADITDDSLEQKTIALQQEMAALKQKTMEGDSAFILTFLRSFPSGFHILKEASYGLLGSVSISGEDFMKLNQLFHAATERKEDIIENKSLREQYKSYKESYVKYLRFYPEKSNLSIKATHSHQDKVSHLYFSCFGGPADHTRGGVHLL